MSAIKDYENNKWKVIGQKVGKPAKVGFFWVPYVYSLANHDQACEQYAKEHFPGMDPLVFQEVGDTG